MKKNKKGDSELILHPKSYNSLSPTEDNEPTEPLSEFDLLSLIQKLMEQQEDLGQQISDLQVENKNLTQNYNRLLGVTELLTSLGQHHPSNIPLLVRYLGKTLTAGCVVYDRIQGQELQTYFSWGSSGESKVSESTSEGFIHDLFLSDSTELIFIPNLSDTKYYQSERFISAHEFKTYLGKIIRVNDKPIGILSCYFSEIYTLNPDDNYLISLISEALKKEEILHQEDLSKTDFQRLLTETESISKTGGWEYSPCNKKLTWTQEVFRIYGLNSTNSDKTLENLEKAYTCYQEEDQKIIIKAFHDALEKGIAYDLELRFKSYDGKQKWIRTIGNPIKENGKIVKLSGNIVDITERKLVELALKESELRFHDLLDKVSNIAVQGYGPDGAVRYWNKASEVIYGYTAEEVIGKNLVDLIIPPGIRDMVRKDIQKMIETGKGNPAEELKLMRKDGALIPVLSNHTVIEIPGKGKELYCIDIDLRERNQVQDALIKSEEKLKKLNASKDKLFSILAHDMRTPFNSILGFSDLLLDNLHKYDLEKIGKYLTHINLQARSTFNLLENLLIWAKSGINQLNVKMEKVALRPNLLQIINNLQPSACAKNIKLTLIQAPDITIDTDIYILEIILRNLISNSVKYTHQGGNIEVYVTIEKDDLKFKISDNGVGMSEETQQKVFRMDTSFSTEGTLNEKGTGLGLILCIEFIEKLKGRIWVDSKENEGSNFYFTLPYQN